MMRLLLRRNGRISSVSWRQWRKKLRNLRLSMTQLKRVTHHYCKLRRRYHSHLPCSLISISPHLQTCTAFTHSSQSCVEKLLAAITPSVFHPPNYLLRVRLTSFIIRTARRSIKATRKGGQPIRVYTRTPGRRSWAGGVSHCAPISFGAVGLDGY